MDRGGEVGVSKRVLVLGEGIAGLVSALALVELGHDPLILEAQDRVGRAGPHVARYQPGTKLSESQET